MSDRVTYAQAAEVLGCHVSNVPKLVAKGYLVSERRRDGALDLYDVLRLREFRLEEATGGVPGARPASASPDEQHDWLAPSDVAARLGVTPQAILQRARRGRLPAVRRGHPYWIRAEHAEILLNARAGHHRP